MRVLSSCSIRAFLTLMERRACASRDSRLPHGTISSHSRPSEPDPRLRRKYFGPGGCKNPSFGWPLPGGFATPVLHHSMPDVAQFPSGKRKTRTNTIVRDFLAPQVGLEPTTLRLTAECSAIELLRNIGLLSLRTELLYSVQGALSTPVFNFFKISARVFSCRSVENLP